MAQSDKLPPAEVWRRLAPIEPYCHFTPPQIDNFLGAYQQSDAIKIVAFAAHRLICRKGEYELDLCFVLSGAVELHDEVAGKGRTWVATLPAGSMYGELGALSGLPRSTDIVAGPAGAEILYIASHALKVIEANPEARKLLMERYRDRAVRVLAAEVELFEGVSGEFIDRLIPHCELQRYDLRGVTIIRQGDEGDAFYIVRSGFVQVVRQREDGSIRVLAYLRAGEYFGEMALLGEGRRYASVLTAGKCELLRIGRADFLDLCRQFPDVERRLFNLIERRRREEQQITPELSAMLATSGQLGMIQADALLVMDLERCVKCDACVTACQTLHGESRLIRTGITLGKYLVPAACRHCDDPRCMSACPTGAVKRRPGGEIFFQYDLCIGCANCAIACPYDNIAMIETPRFDAAQARKQHATGNRAIFRPLARHDAQSWWERVAAAWRERRYENLAPALWRRILHRNRSAAAPPAQPGSARPHVPLSYPIKCDLCDGLPFMGCVHSCPTGAAMRIDPAVLFAQTGALSIGSRVSKAHGDND